MQLDWLTVSAQLVNFLILVWLLKRFLYQPVIDAMSRREERIAARLNEAQQRTDDADAQRHAYLEKTQALERERDAIMSRAHELAREERQRLLNEARHDVDRLRDNWHQELRHEHREIKDHLRRTIALSALGIARNMLVDLADDELERLAVAKLLRELDRQPSAARAPLATAGEPIRVTTSFTLGAEARERLTAALRSPDGIEFANDPDLICGISLSAGGHSLDWNMSAHLDEAEARIQRALDASVSDLAERA